MAKNKIASIQKAFARLKDDYSQVKKIHLSPDGLHLEIELQNQSIGLDFDPSSKTLEYKSPFSGIYRYSYDPIEGRFQSVKDKHILDEILVRE